MDQNHCIDQLWSRKLINRSVNEDDFVDLNKEYFD